MKNSKHTHQLEYGQTAEDFQKNHIQVRCTKCDYKSYSVAVKGLRG